MPNSRKDYKLYLLDIESSCRKIIRYTKQIDHVSFANNQMLIDAVIRNLEIIGEAVNKVPLAIKQETKEIPWKEIVGFRNKVIHEYFEVDIPVIWKTVKDDIPMLDKQVKKVLKELGSKQLKLKT